MATNTEKLNLKKPSQTDFYNIDDFNDNFQKIDDFAKRTDNPHGVTAEQTGAISRLNGLLEEDIKVFDTLITKEYAGDWAWLAPADNPFGYPLGTLCAVTNNIIQYAVSIGVVQTIKPVYPTPNCGEIFTRSYYYGNMVSGGSEWTEWKKVAVGEFLPLTGGTLTDILKIFRAVTPALELDTGKSLAQILKNASDTVEDGLLIKDCDNTANYATDYITLRLNHALSKEDITQMLKLSKVVGGASTFYKVFGEHNKPTGSYTGNNSVRTILVGGTGSVLFVCDNVGKFAIISSVGAFVWVNSATNVYNSSSLNFKDGKLFLAGDMGAVLNVSGATYQYQVL